MLPHVYFESPEFWGVIANEPICSIHFGGENGQTWGSGEFTLDNLTLGVDMFPLFADGFESGDASAWSAVHNPPPPPAATFTVGEATTAYPAVIPPNAPNQVLGGFTVSASAELTVNNLSVQVDGAAVTDVILMQDDVAVAGPVDMVGGDVLFGDTFTIPLGESEYLLLGRVPDGTPDGTLIVSITRPALWDVVDTATSSPAEGDPSGNIGIGSVEVWGASLSIFQESIGSGPIVILAGDRGNFARYTLDASESGDGIQLSWMMFPLEVVEGEATNLTNCVLEDEEGVQLNTGSNMVNPSGSQLFVFTLDEPFLVDRGSMVTVSLFCDTDPLTEEPNGYRWGLQDGPWTASGVDSGVNIAPIITPSDGSVVMVDPPSN